MGRAPLGQVLVHDLPVAELGPDEPVDQLVDLALDLLRRVRHDLLLELLLHPPLVEQVHDAAQADRVVEVIVPAAFHLDERLLDVRHAELELAPQVLLVDPQLPIELAEHVHVLAQEFQPTGDVGLEPFRHVFADAERAEQLQAQAFDPVEGGPQVLLERGEPARGHHGRVLRPPPLGRELRAHREDRRGQPEQRARVLPHEGDDRLQLRLAIQDVHLVDDDDDLLAPVADALEKRALALGERAVGRRDEQDEVRPGHELARERLVLAHDRVGPGRVHDVEVAEELDGRRHLGEAGLREAGPGDLRVVADDGDARGGGGDALGEDVEADQHVEDGALAGVELAHHDEQEELVEVGDGAVERRLVGGARAVALLGVAQIEEKGALVGEQGLGGVVEEA